MQPVNLGVIGLGNVGSGTLDILAENADQIALKLGFPLARGGGVQPECGRQEDSRGVRLTAARRRIGARWWSIPMIQIVAELIGGTGGCARGDRGRGGRGQVGGHGQQGIDGAVRRGTVGSCHRVRHQSGDGGERRRRHSDSRGAARRHLRDRITTLYGILNGTCNYILTEIEQRGADFAQVLAEAQAAGYAEADPSADVDGFDARSKLAILSALAFGERIVPADIYTEGIRRIAPIDFGYAHSCITPFAWCARRGKPRTGLLLSVRPSLIPQSTILASVRGAYNAVWVRGKYGADTFYYGRGAGAHPTGVAVVSDLMRVAREIRSGSPERVSPFAHARLGEYCPIPITLNRSAYYLRFRVKDRPGIIAQLAAALAAEKISIEAVLQLPDDECEQSAVRDHGGAGAAKQSIRAALARMEKLEFLDRAAAGDADGSVALRRSHCQLKYLWNRSSLYWKIPVRRDLPLLTAPLDGAFDDPPACLLRR